MFRNNDLLKLNVTLVLLVATAFGSVAAVAAAGSDTIIQVKAASAAIGGTADTVFSAGAPDLSDYFLRHPDASIPANTVTDASISSLLDNPNGHWIGPETVSAALGQLTALSTVDKSNGYWIGPETVSAALGQLQPDLQAASDMYYGPPGR